MAKITRSLILHSPDETCALAHRIGVFLAPGDVLLLEGGIGAGKTHFARCLIQSLLSEPEDVPSPTFTLVQAYDADVAEIWHADLYRLSSPDEIIELGLVDAFQDAICLVEWPDRLSDLTPKDALHMQFSMLPEEGQRALDLTAQSERWAKILKEVTDG